MNVHNPPAARPGSGAKTGANFPGDLRVSASPRQEDPADGLRTVPIVVNGEPRSAPEGQTILGLLRDLGVDPARVAVELDRRIVKQARWEDTALASGSRLEIVQFVGGG